MAASTILRFFSWKRPASILIANGVCLVLFPTTVCLLIVRAGYAVPLAAAWVSSHTLGLAVTVGFWVTAIVSWPISFFGLLYSGAFFETRGPRQSSIATWVAWGEVAAWGLIWIMFAAIFFPTIACGL